MPVIYHSAWYIAPTVLYLDHIRPHCLAHPALAHLLLPYAAGYIYLSLRHLEPSRTLMTEPNRITIPILSKPFMSKVTYCCHTKKHMLSCLMAKRMTLYIGIICTLHLFAGITAGLINIDLFSLNVNIMWPCWNIAWPKMHVLSLNTHRFTLQTFLCDSSNNILCLSVNEIAVSSKSQTKVGCYPISPIAIHLILTIHLFPICDILTHVSSIEEHDHSFSLCASDNPHLLL